MVMTRQNVSQLDDFQALADNYNATLRITRMRPSGRSADVGRPAPAPRAAARPVQLACRTVIGC